MVLFAIVALIATQKLEVGDGKPFKSISAALEAANSGDEIDVYPSSSHYRGEHVNIAKAKILIKGIGPDRVKVDGGDFEYSGSGQIPRAILQIDAGADGVRIENLELSGAHNKSFNGAGVRIDGANDASVISCDIHGNDMGIMSGSHPGTPAVAKNQVIDGCKIHENGNQGEAGYNHNLYLGGDSVTLNECEIFKPLTGHNLKSRAHFMMVSYCSIHDAFSREVDLVDSEETAKPNSNAVFIGNVIAKDPNCPGNHRTIHFGQEKGLRNGTLYLFNNTIVTPFSSPVVTIDGETNQVEMVNNVIVNSSEHNPTLIGLSGDATADQVKGSNNWISSSYVVPAGLTSRFQGTVWNSSPLATEGINTVDPNIEGKPRELPLYLDGDGTPRQATLRKRMIGRNRWANATSLFFGAG